MYGIGIIKGLGVTLKNFIITYKDDLSFLATGGRYYNEAALQKRQSLEGKGVMTVFYPEEKLETPERFRFVPFLVTDDPPPGQKWGHDWCTSCGICAKVCPPQCIWIERGKQPNGRPKPEPQEFFIDIDICMNCGLCAEFCPFDAIKMDHDYELASYDRTTAHIHDKERLSKPLSYWQSIAPRKATAEAAARAYVDAAKARKKDKSGDGDEPEDRIAEAMSRQLVYKGLLY